MILKAFEAFFVIYTILMKILIFDNKFGKLGKQWNIVEENSVV